MSELVLTLRQRAQVGDRSREDFVLATMEHIPGTVVRGAFAACWLARHGVSAPGTPQRREFLRLFEGEVRFGALLRPGTEFVPLSVVQHKYTPRDSCQVVDYDEAAGGEIPGQCPDCGSPLEQAKALAGERPAIRRRTSVSVGESGVARSGVLFTRETLEAGQEFRGTLVAGHDLAQTLAGLGPVRVGGRRTTHGLADVAVRDVAPPPAAERREDGRLILRLRSPGIFADSWGRPRRDPDPAELSEVLGTAAQVERCWTRWQQVGGWHVASGLPKPTELAVAAGSTYVIDTERAVPDTVLQALAERGLGLRRHEGFGDLAPPPALRKGQQARQEEARALRVLMDKVISLAGVPVRWPERWPALITALTGHTRGDAAATTQLRQAAADPFDAAVAAALRAFLELPPQDAATVVERLGQS